MSPVRMSLGRAKSNKAEQPQLDEREVTQAAYELYLQRGQADGHALEDWLRAEAIVRQRHGLTA